MSTALLLLLLLCTGHAVYVRPHQTQERHLGCAEKALQAFEHLLLPRILRCTETECRNDGSLLLPIQTLQCIDPEQCTARVFCQTRISDVYYGLAITLVGFIAVLVFVCAPMPHSRVAVKLHKT